MTVRRSLLGVGFLALACGSTPASNSPGAPEPPVPTQETSKMTDPSSPQGRYEAWLSAQGRPVEGVVQATLQDAGETSFFFTRTAPGHKADAAAVRGEDVVTAGQPGGWASFLRSADAATLHQQVAWLNGSWMATGPGYPDGPSILKKFPQAGALWSAPSLSESGTAVEFSAWYAVPPQREPFRFTIRASGDADATFTRESLRDLNR